MNPSHGGPGQFIRNLAPWFAGPEHSMEVVCLDDPKSAYLNGEPLQIHALGQGRGSWNYHPALLPWLQRHGSRFDAIFLNGLWQYPGLALSRITRSLPGPGYFVIPHGMLDPWFQKFSVRPWKSLRNWLYWKLVEQQVVNQSSGLLFTCAEERRLARLQFRPYAPRQESVVGLGVPAPPALHQRMRVAFAQKCPDAGTGNYLLFLGRIHPKKGIDLLIKAYAGLGQAQNSAARTPRPRLVMAGPDGQTAFGQAMQKLAADLCPAGDIVWPGMLTGDAKWGALYHCAAFILPSHQENFGIAVVEALACGRPVLISHQINIWREIEQSGAALVEKDDLQGTTRLLRNWCQLSAQGRDAMVVQAKQCYETLFSGEMAARNFLKVALAAVRPAALTTLRYNET
jgi:glycosyltransferase involved in cell wall biosynthesis